MIIINFSMKKIIPVITVFIDIIVVYSLSPFKFAGTKLI